MRDRIIKLSLHGVTAGTPPPPSDHVRGEKNELNGWSARSSRSNVAFLRSVDFKGLVDDQGEDLDGIALTLTVRDCPPTHDHWKKLREAFFVRLRRRGLVMGHWVTEWQKRGVPHMHGAFYFPSGTLTNEFKKGLLSAWVDVAFDYSPSLRSQHATPIHDALGWVQYTAKHLARGYKHYQRSSENVPHEWKQKTGRIWGKIGKWPTKEPEELTLNSDEFFRFRRIVRSWRVALHRSNLKDYAEKKAIPDLDFILRSVPQTDFFQSKKDLTQFALDHCCKFHKKLILSARNMLNCKNKNLSSVRGVSEWIPYDLGLEMAFAARSASINAASGSPSLPEARGGDGLPEVAQMRSKKPPKPLKEINFLDYL